MLASRSLNQLPELPNVLLDPLTYLLQLRPRDAFLRRALHVRDRNQLLEIELDRHRSSRAKSRLDHVIRGDFLRHRLLEADRARVAFDLVTVSGATREPALLPGKR